MFAFIVRRLLNSIPTVFGVAVVVFALFDLVGGDPTYQMAGKHANEKVLQEIRHEYGFDQPKHIQFVNYLKQIVTFDYGRSYATKQQISSMILSGIGPSATLMLPAFLISTILSVLISLLVAYHRGRFIDRAVVVLCVFGMSVPMLAYILFGQYYLAYMAGWFPIAGWENDWSMRLSYVALPAILYVILDLGGEVRFYRTAIVEETMQDYVRTARAKGLSESRVYLKHVLKNSMIPVITNVVVQIPFLILGAFLLEVFFGIPGLGGITITAVHNSDFPVIKAMCTLEALLFIAGDLFTNVLYAIVDPRVALR